MKELTMNQVTLSVTDIERSFYFFEKLGLYPIVKSEHYARFIVPGNEATLSIHKADKVVSSTTIYFEVENVDFFCDELKSKGFHLEQDPVDQRWDWREAYISDPDGNKICIYRAGRIRVNPDWRLEESKGKHLLTEDHFKDWLERYKHAWETESPEKAAELFTEDASYFETPFDEPFTGTSKIIDYWNAVPEGQSEISFGYEIIKVHNNTGFSKWNASFVRSKTGSKVLLDGIFEISFDRSGKAVTFKEWWHRKETG